MDVKEGTRKGIRQNTTDQSLRRVGWDTEIQTPAAEAAEEPTPNWDQLVAFTCSFYTSKQHKHGVCSRDGDHHCCLWQRDFPQENPESNPQRSVVSFCGELDCDPVLVCSLHFSYELWEEDPGVSKQTQHELVTVDRWICLYFLFNLS